MNCKPGDLAIIVDSDAGNEGLIVRVIQLDYHSSSLPTVDRKGKRIPPTPYWEIDRYIQDFEGGLHKTIADFQLRPIRDPGEDAKDQTLEWLPVPSKEKETA
jgi:hypothetical protein